MSDNIKVVVKVRPLISREIEEKLSYQWRVKNDTLHQLDQNGKEQGPFFTFDKVYDKEAKTLEVYNDIAKPIVEAAVAGFNGTIFAYGQTSSGKTYTMTGTESSPGIIPLAVLNLFEIIKNVPDRDFLVRVSYIEIYNDTVKDLLNIENNNIKVQDTQNQGIKGIKVDSTEKVTSSPEEVLEAMKEGEANRQKGATIMNEESSRSHSIFQITIESREHVEDGNEAGCVNVSQLNLVDLAGSERAGQSGATGKRFKEGTHINKSLSALALVIKQLSEDNKFANYRDSKLTRILQNSLGGNAKTSIICAVTPAAVEETISTLQFANRAKAIKNKPEVNAVATDATMIQSLTKQMSRLQSQLESKKNLEQDNYNLQKQIHALQKLILNGFGQSRSTDLMQGTRRKLQQPRRVTIHSTMATIDDEPVVNIPKFRTPCLKYNPLSLALTATETPATQVNTKLPPVPEEPARTPPQKTVCFNNEIIELDSDDDSVPDDNEVCSPIHKCYDSSKTPPCVLRKNAKLAERNLKDIVVLTEREKIFSPSAVELIEKLEHNSTVITKLQDENEILIKQTKEYDIEMQAMKIKIKKNEDEIQALCSAKLELQTQCNNYVTKLTDWEVTYETLRNKAKLREKELLSLLDEVKVKKPEDIGKILCRTLEKDIPFMDMSKDISLVNSDNESSVVQHDDETENINKIITDSHAQLITKNENIFEMEANLFAHKQTIASLETQTQELNETLSTYKEKLNNIETENSLLKSTIDTLNNTISKQDDNLKAANNDIQSYNDAMQELQIKLKTGVSKINCDNSTLEVLVSNEEQFMANNENISNIIQSFKNAFDVRNQEVIELKEKHRNDASFIKDLLDQLQSKTAEINKLSIDVDDFRKEINNKVALINKLMLDKGNLQTLEQELTQKLNEAENANRELVKINNDNTTCIQHLKTENIDKNKYLLQEIENLSTQIFHMEKNCNEKDEIISCLNREQLESKENLDKAKSAVLKLQNILSILSGNMHEVPEIIDNFVNIFSALSENLSTLEIVASSIATKNKQAEENKGALKAEIEQMQLKYNSDITTLQNQIEILTKTNHNYKQEEYNLKNSIKSLDNLLNDKTLLNNGLESKLNNVLEAQNLTMSTKQELFEQNLLKKENMIGSLTEKLETVTNELGEKTLQSRSFEELLNKTNETKFEQLKNISNKITEIIDHLNIESNSIDDIVDSDGIYKRILYTLNEIEENITHTNLKSIEDCNNKISDQLNRAKLEIAELTNKNRNLELKINDMEKHNQNLLDDVQKNENNNKKLNKDLMLSQQLLQNLQIELQSKETELTLMLDKITNLKEQFNNLDVLTKQQTEELTAENENLKYHIEALKKQSESSASYYKQTDTFKTKNSDVYNKKTTSADINMPPRLATICCNKIVHCMDFEDNQSKTTTDSNTDVEVRSSDVTTCKCSELSFVVNAAEEENSRILDLLAQMDMMNQQLLHEQDLVREELRLLVEPAQTLQKKIVSHKTNLSILTATTQAENKLLKSQVKVLQHHHKRFHNVCQRDIPDFKKQLSNLMLLLNPSAGDQLYNFKRYSLPDFLDSSTALPNFNNESTLDGDMLMLDTNVTLTTAADNDQTCLDMTQFYSEASCQTYDLSQTTDQIVQNKNMLENTNILKEKNAELREILNKTSEMRQSMIDAQVSPIQYDRFLIEGKLNDSRQNTDECANCKEMDVLKQSQEKLRYELEQLSEELSEVKTKKADFELKYNNLILETPNTDNLIKKLSNLEQENNCQKKEIDRKNEELKDLLFENDSLSNQIMESISETDDLNKELNEVKQKNNDLLEKCEKLGQNSKEYLYEGDLGSCCQCATKSLQAAVAKCHTKLNRSLSDSDTSSRYNKICTLQSELHAGKEDCKELTEDVATIKNHLERSNLAMDLDDSLTDANFYTYTTKDYEVSSPQSNKCKMPDIPEERTSDMYIMDKMDCFNYYSEKTGIERHNLNPRLKIIEVMKMLYENLLTKHGNEVENLTNKLKDFKEAKNQLQNQYHNLVENNSKIIKQLEEKETKSIQVGKILSQIRNNISAITANGEIDKSKLVKTFRENLALLDSEFELHNVEIFQPLLENIVEENKLALSGIMDQYRKLQENVDAITKELNSVNENTIKLKSQLSDKETEYNLLKSQKEKIQEISNAVTLDIVKREKELKDTIDKGYIKLIDLEIVKSENVNSNLALNTNINLLFELLVTQNKSSLKNNEKDTILLELNNLKVLTQDKQKEIDLLKNHNEQLLEVNHNITRDVADKDNKLHTLNTLYADLNKIYESKVEENKVNATVIKKLTEEVAILKTNMTDREMTIIRLKKEVENHKNDESRKLIELIETVKRLEDDITNLKSINEMINTERDSYAAELKKSGDTITKNNIDLDKMMSDILVLRESVKENSSVIDNLNAEAKTLLEQNVQLKEQLDIKCKECSRLETNIKTHEKTAQIQTRMIRRLEKKKVEDDKILNDTKQQLAESSQKYLTLQEESETYKAELELLKKTKEDLEARISAQEAEGAKRRSSIDAIAETARRRRQSFYDSKRTYSEDKHTGEHHSVEEVFDSRPKPDDLFMDVDEVVSNRSTPIRFSKGRESLSLSRTDQSDKDEEHPSRPSSALESRRRRQTLHDSHRNELSNTPSPCVGESTVTQLRERLACCQQELEELKEKYRDLDEECETCSEYLKESEKQCARLKKEKLTLQTTVTELEQKLQSSNPNMSQMVASKSKMVHASVNTDEDWANLHSVVVDRMSYDAEVEKNKKLNKNIEELRFKNQDLKNSISKMQKALEKHSGNREMEKTKLELEQCKQELSQLKVKYRDLDEECDTCARYLREREAQCRRLKEAKAALETKLEELTEANPVPHTARKKRQSVHDQNRASTVDVVDKATETDDDLLSYRVNRDAESRPVTEEKHAKEVKFLKLAVERLSQQKQILEQQLSATAQVAYPPMYVATGSAIIQNQQITDIMKENQKLKQVNAKLIKICKKRGKDSNRENEKPND